MMENHLDNLDYNDFNQQLEYLVAIRSFYFLLWSTKIYQHSLYDLQVDLNQIIGCKF